MTKKNIMPVAVLTVICVVVAILLATVNYFTAPIIEKEKERKVNESLYAVLEDATGFENITLDGNQPDTVVSAHKDKGGSGYVIVLETSTSYTSGAKMSITVGIGTDGVIKGVSLNAYSETKDFGKETYPKTYIGLTGDDIDTSNSEHLVSGVTYSSKAFKAAIKDALNYATVLGGGEVEEPTPEVLPKTDEEIITLATSLVGEGATFEDVTPEGGKLVKRVYKEKSGKGYVAYLVVISPDYGTVETETLVHFSNSGKIAGVSKLTWKTSDAIYGYEPPTPEVVDEFYAKLKDNNSESFKEKFTGEGAEVVTNATNTTGRLTESITEAFAAVDALIVKDMPRDEAEVKTLAATLVGEGATFEDVTPDDRNYIRKVYKEKSGKGYVAYLVVISPNYGTVETETLVYFDNSGKIVGVNKLTWKTSDAIYGYEPPTPEAVDEFYAKLKDNNSESFKAKFTGEGAEVVANATNTTSRLTESITEAFAAVDDLIFRDMPRNESEVEALAKALVGEGAELEKVELGATRYVRRFYEDKGGKGYVAYLVVISPNYGTVETETLVHFDNSGKIAGVNKLTWKTSDAIYGYVPPTPEAVDEFYAKLKGNDSKSFAAKFTGEGAEVVANATNTTGRLAESIAEAFGIVDDIKPISYAPRVVGIIILAVALASVVAIVVFKIVRRRKV